MFTTSKLEPSVPLAREELRRLHELLELYESTPGGAWMRDIPWRAYQYRWCEAMRSGDVMGAYLPIRGNRIYLQPCDRTGLNAKSAALAWVGLIASTAVHELRHAWQFRRNRLLYVLCSLPLLREITLERDAKRVWDAADKVFQSAEAHRAACAFEEHGRTRRNTEEHGA